MIFSPHTSKQATLTSNQQQYVSLFLAQHSTAQPKLPACQTHCEEGLFLFLPCWEEGHNKGFQGGWLHPCISHDVIGATSRHQGLAPPLLLLLQDG